MTEQGVGGKDEVSVVAGVAGVKTSSGVGGREIVDDLSGVSRVTVTCSFDGVDFTGPDSLIGTSYLISGACDELNTI